MSTRSRMIVSTSRPTYPTSVNLVASTLMNGASASRASRRAISVLPTPVGPIMRMFLGVISWRSGSATCCRRQRLRSAIATARFARPCPTMNLSSSCTISWGVMLLMSERLSFQRLYSSLMIRIDAQVGRNRQRLLDDVARTELGVLEQRLGRALRIGPARADRDHPLFGLEHVAHAGDDERMLTVGDGEHGLEAAEDAGGAPVLGELHRGAH